MSGTAQRTISMWCADAQAIKLTNDIDIRAQFSDALEGAVLSKVNGVLHFGRPWIVDQNAVLSLNGEVGVAQIMDTSLRVFGMRIVTRLLDPVRIGEPSATVVLFVSIKHAHQAHEMILIGHVKPVAKTSNHC